MMLLKNTHDIEKLNEALGRCHGDVILRSADGREEYNLKSGLSRYVAIGMLCQDEGDSYEVFCMDRSDESTMMHFFYDLEHETLKCA